MTCTSASRIRFGSGRHVPASGGPKPGVMMMLLNEPLMMVDDDDGGGGDDGSTACLCHPLYRQRV